MTRQQHPDSLRRQARQVYERHGSRRAAEITGVARRTVNLWARQEGWQRRLATTQAPEQRVQPTVPPVPDRLPKTAASPASGGYQAQRRRLLDRFLARANGALDQAERCEQTGKAHEHSRWMTSAGIATDKCEVLAKAIGAGGVEWADPATAVARLSELVDVVTDRAAGDG